MAEDSMKHLRIAQELNKECEEMLKGKKLHFRGNNGSFSLISLDRKTPEQGKGGFKDKEQGKRFLHEGIDLLLASKTEKIEAGNSRPTREKELQAWIIDYAINHEYRLPFSEGLTFLTSELAFNNPKIVNDILALDQNGSLVVIELKSSRDKTTLEGQVKRFFDKIDGDRPFFHNLVKLLVPEKDWNEQKRGMIVWPDSKVWPNEHGQPRTDWDHGIKEFRYKEKSAEVGGKEQRLIYYNEKEEIIFL
jgi:RecB family endonuclease NucS